ncbi:MAG: hypothetical protein ACLGXA_15605 [Acidobacteriota bacterium]
MTQIGSSNQEDLVVGYFSDGAHAYRAINELIDEGFRASEIGAAFRSRRPGAEAPVESGEMRNVRELTERNPAVSGSVGGVASHDEAVTPAGLAPGSGNAFPAAPSSPGPIPGAEIPSTLPHDLPHTLPHDLPATSRARSQSDDRWVDHLHRNWGSSSAATAKNRNTAAAGNQKFGTGEGTLGLFPDHAYSEPAFESSFVGMGLAPEHARSLSGDLSRGGAVITVSAGARASLAEAILERNHGRIRFEPAASTTTLRASDRESPVEVYGSMSNYYRPEEELRRKAS